MPVVMIECPRLLFPFARQIIADATRNGGFPPLMHRSDRFRRRCTASRLAEMQAGSSPAGQA